MDIGSVQQSAFQRQVNPARGSDQRHREDDGQMQNQLRQAEGRQRAEDQQREQRQQQEFLRPERRLDGRLVRVGAPRQDGRDPDQARSDLMRQKIAQTYSAGQTSGSSAPVYEQSDDISRSEQAEPSQRSQARENIDFVV